MTRHTTLRQRLGCLLPASSVAIVMLGGVHIGATAAIQALGGLEALMGSVDVAAMAAIAYIALFTARLTLLFVLPGLLLYALVEISIIRPLSKRIANES